MTHSSGPVFEGRALVAGEAAGPVVALAEPLSFWGGFDAETGRVADRRHPQFGTLLAGAILVMPFGRGSSSSTTILAEAIRVGNAPAAIVLKEPDEILVVGALVAEELYGVPCTVVVLGEADHAALARCASASVTTAGAVIGTP